VKVAKEDLPDRRRRQSSLQVGAGLRALGEAFDRCRVLHAQRELELAELERLEAAGRIEAVAETQELERGHRLENVDLRDECLEDGQDAIERAESSCAVAGGELLAQVVDLVQFLFEPEFVHLVDDDEEHLVVFGRIGLPSLQ